MLRNKVAGLDWFMSASADFRDCVVLPKNSNENSQLVSLNTALFFASSDILAFLSQARFDVLSSQKIIVGSAILISALKYFLMLSV